ncbi:MAG TPA: sensor domain-containing protein [Thermoanaerobaculia bacterium]|nr:sensor domain-containing protein [Thermoanaerobaculia bacterium]
MGSPVTGFRSTPLGRFLCAPFELRSYANLLYLALAFPLGLAYFVFLVVGLSVGLGTVIIWVGVPILAAVLAGSFAFSMFERELAIRLLGAEVPPMTPAAGGPQSVSQRIKAFLKNPVTWKGLGYLAVKFPLGLGTFVLVVTLSSITLALLLAPLYYGWIAPDLVFSLDDGTWVVDSLGGALACSAAGALFGLVALNLFNGLAFAWRKLADLMLGSPRFAAPAPSPVPTV